jgi:hypothetical protein
MSFFRELNTALESLGVSKQMDEAQRRTGVKCGVARGLLGTEVLEKFGKPISQTYIGVFGEPQYDGTQAPTPEEMNRLRRELKKKNLL